MKANYEADSESLAYHVGLDKVEEAVISSHFMDALCRNRRLALYNDEEFSAKSVSMPASAVNNRLLPTLRNAADAFAHDRAQAAKRRAAENVGRYEVDAPAKLGAAEFITEVMFDRQFRRGSRETCSRQEVHSKVALRIAAGAKIEMVVPALPYKISCPLKTRGRLPDLAEANFLLGLYEIVAAVETLYREARPDLPAPIAHFTVVSDGGRFSQVVNESDDVAQAYQHELTKWIERLRLEEYIEVIDYHVLLRERLPNAARDMKTVLRERASCQYRDLMWQVFDPYDISATLSRARLIDPDPETSNAAGRFVSLFKSLIFTVNYLTLDPFKALSNERFRTLYHELTRHIFEPFVRLSDPELRSLTEQLRGHCGFPDTAPAKEYLRQEMLREAWAATIGYIAEIKSDRDLAIEPITACLPDHLRWTIHAKPGQLGLGTPAALGKPVQAWAGAAVFKRVGQRGIRLCTLPVLALEGVGAKPVLADDFLDSPGAADQPLFYIYPDIDWSGIEDFLSMIATRVTRKRAS
jgi:hypothetical protein